jgi:hypothetical protein
MWKEYRPRMFESKVLRKCSGSKTERVTGERRQSIMRSFHNLYSSSNIIGKIKLIMRLMEHVVHMGGKGRGTYWVFQWLKLKARDRLAD